MSKIFDENIYFDKLKEFNFCLKRAIHAQCVLELLDLHNVPDGTVIFNSPKKKYVNKAGVECEYQYTHAYLYINGVKYHISKKHNYPKKNCRRDLNDPSNPDNRLILQERLMMRMQAKSELKYSLANAKLLIAFLNSNKPRDLPRIILEEAKKDAENDFWFSAEGRNLPNLIEHFLDEQSCDTKCFCDLRPTIEAKYENFFLQQVDEMTIENSGAQSNLPELCVSNVVSRRHKNKRHWYKVRGKSDIKTKLYEQAKFELSEDFDLKNANFRETFSNEILNDSNERVRSKNEVIAVKCAKDCGISYNLEPYYPGSYWRADMAVHACGRDIWIEIAGMRNDPEYEKHLKEKITFAKSQGIYLVVIDMTAYNNAKGKAQTRLHYITLCRIFQYIQLGLLREGIVMPY